MTKVLFIHGGFGNALLQLAYLNMHEKDFVVSAFFTRKIIRKIFGFTDHPKFFRDKVDVKDAGILGLVLLPLVLFDLVIAKMFKHSLVTEFDIRFIKARPVLKKLAYFGYFQSDIDLGSVLQLRRFLRPQNGKSFASGKVVIHIRGGDFRHTSQALDHAYYSKALTYIYEQKKFKGAKFLVITNDFDYSRYVLRKSGLNLDEFDFSSGNEAEDFNFLHSCDCLISSNSTFALTAALTKPNKKTILLPKGVFEINETSDFDVVYI